MNKFLGSTPLEELLPSSIAKDDTIRAMAEAVHNVLTPSVAGMSNLLLFARLMGTGSGILPPLHRVTELDGGLSPLSGELLDALAWQYHVDAYDAAKDEDVKREMLLQSLLLHRRKGTPWAVRTALSTVLALPVTVREWFDYGGRPHFFRVAFDVSDSGMDDAMLGRIAITLQEQKNVRSWLDFLQTTSVRVLPYRVGMACATVTQGGARHWMPHVDASKLLSDCGLVVMGQTQTHTDAWMPPADAPHFARRTALALQAVDSMRTLVWSRPLSAPTLPGGKGLVVMGGTAINMRPWMPKTRARPLAKNTIFAVATHSYSAVQPFCRPKHAEITPRRSAMTCMISTISALQPSTRS